MLADPGLAAGCSLISASGSSGAVRGENRETYKTSWLFIYIDFGSVTYVNIQNIIHSRLTNIANVTILTRNVIVLIRAINISMMTDGSVFIISSGRVDQKYIYLSRYSGIDSKWSVLHFTHWLCNQLLSFSLTFNPNSQATTW